MDAKVHEMTARSSVTIGLLLPDVLGTYSDSGNATVLAQRLRWRGIPAEVLRCTADQAPPTSCDIYLLGGGEDTAQLFAADWLADYPALCRALATTSVTLAVCAGMQILGRTMVDSAGRRHRGVGLLDITTRPRRRRAIGNIVTTSQLPGVGKLCGFENHRGATTLGEGARPLGHVVTGVGNGGHGLGQHRHEGAMTDRIVGTYLHGPVLARNPALADHLLARVVGQPLPPLELPDQAALRRGYLQRTHR
jgi:CobQ-like glutamine amidotransferase family enzyme